MGPKTTRGKAKCRAKQTSTPLQEGENTASFPSLKNMSAVKMLCKRTDYLSMGSLAEMKGNVKKKRSTSSNPFRKTSIATKKPRRDTPLKPRRKSSQKTSFSVAKPKKLKFSRISDSFDLPKNTEYHEDNSSLDDENLVGRPKADVVQSIEQKRVNADYCLPISGQNDREVQSNDSQSHSSASKYIDEFITAKVTRKNGVDTSESSVPRRMLNIDSSRLETSEGIPQNSVNIDENMMDASDSIETCRRQSGNFAVSSTINYSFDLEFLSDEYTKNTPGKNIRPDSHDQSSIILCKDSMNGHLIENEKSKVFQENDTYSEEIPICGKVSMIHDFAFDKITSTVSTSTCSTTIPYAYGDSEACLEKKMDSSYGQQARILEALDEKANVILNDDKYTDHPQSKISDENIMKKSETDSCKIKSEAMKLHNPVGRKTLGPQAPANDCNLANKAIDGKENFINPLSTAKNNTKKYSRKQKKLKDAGCLRARPNTWKKSGKVKEIKEIISYPSTSTPFNSPEIMYKKLPPPFEDISPLTKSRKSNAMKNYEVDDFLKSRIKDTRAYGKSTKVKQRSEVSRKWESFINKGTKHYVQKENNNHKESRNSKTAAHRNKCLLFQSPSLILLENVPIDDIVKSRYESVEMKDNRNSEAGKINEGNKKPSRKRWYESKKMQKLARHFDEISNYSLIIETKDETQK